MESEVEVDLDISEGRGARRPFVLFRLGVKFEVSSFTDGSRIGAVLALIMVVGLGLVGLRLDLSIWIYENIDVVELGSAFFSTANRDVLVGVVTSASAESTVNAVGITMFCSLGGLDFLEP